MIIVYFRGYRYLYHIIRMLDQSDGCWYCNECFWFIPGTITE
jgi:hypothetical protein